MRVLDGHNNFRVWETVERPVLEIISWGCHMRYRTRAKEDVTYGVERVALAGFTPQHSS